jgi:hypothetical protein
VKRYENIQKKPKLNCEMIWKIWKKGKLKCEMIWKIWKKGKSNREKSWKIQKKIVKRYEKYGKYGRKRFFFYKTINTACNLFMFTVCPTVRGNNSVSEGINL